MNFSRRGMLVATLTATMLAVPAIAASAAVDPGTSVDICTDPASGLPSFDAPTSEPLAECQWNMAMIGADMATFATATGAGVRVGVIDSGVDTTHPDIAPNLDLDASCSFITDSAPVDFMGTHEIPETADPCDDKVAVMDQGSHGTHVASTIAAPINGIGIAGVAPEAEIVALKACVAGGYCMADSVAAALRYAGDIGLDMVNLSLYADPYHFYCNSVAEERTILRELQSATRYAQQHGVVVVVSAGNDAWDLQHPPETDSGSPSPGEPVERDIENNCVVAPGELPGVVTVSALGPFGLADYSTTGMSRVDVTAPGGDYFQTATDHSGVIQAAILAAASAHEDPQHGIFGGYDGLNPFYPGITVIDQGAPYVELNGTSMASPHATGVLALIKELNPNWGPGALKAALQRTADDMACPQAGAVDDFFSDPDSGGYRACQGNGGRTSYFGHGLVSAANAVG